MFPQTNELKWYPCLGIDAEDYYRIKDSEKKAGEGDNGYA